MGYQQRPIKPPCLPYGLLARRVFHGSCLGYPSVKRASKNESKVDEWSVTTTTHHFVLPDVKRRKHDRRNRNRWKKAPPARSKVDKCATKRCRNQKAKHKTVYKKADGTTKVYENRLEHCWKCRSRMLKERQPVTYVLNMLRHSAKKRKLPFTITKAEFEKFCADTRYLELRGNEAHNLTIDRVDPNAGYHLWNMRVLTHADNSAQGVDNTPRAERGCEVADEVVGATDEPF